jgi:hypothetical protein
MLLGLQGGMGAGLWGVLDSSCRQLMNLLYFTIVAGMEVVGVRMVYLEHAPHICRHSTSVVPALLLWNGLPSIGRVD